LSDLASQERAWDRASPVAASAGSSQARGEDAGFHGADAFEALAVFGDGLGEVDFEGADGREGLADTLAVRFEGRLFSGGEDMDLAGEAVAIGVETRARLPRRGRGAGGMT
jgi:hypothetical protein